MSASPQKFHFISGLPRSGSTLLAALLGTTVLLAWWRCGRDLLSLTTLLYAPVYALKKLPLYLGFALKRQVEWVRSRRDEP